LIAGLLLALASLAGVAWSGWSLSHALGGTSQGSTQGGSVINFGGMSMPVHYSYNGLPVPDLCIILVEQLLALGAGVTTIVAAFAMHKHESFGLSRAGSILACVPLSPVWVVTFPLGLRAALLLRRPEVRAAFDRSLGDETGGLTPLGSPGETTPLWRPPSLRTAGGWNLLLFLLGALITLLPWYRENIFGITATVSGLDSWHGRVCGGAFAVALILLVICELRQAAAWVRGLISVAAGGLVIALTGHDIWETLFPPQPTIKTSLSGDTQVFGDFFKAMTKQFTDMVSSIQVESLIGSYAALACGAAVLALGVWQLRRGKPLAA
jgi:hypothetical protein